MPRKADSDMAEDGHTFVLPETFFAAGNLSGFCYPAHASFLVEDNDPKITPAVAAGAVFRLSMPENEQAWGPESNPKFILLQFLRPTVWKIRFDPTKQAVDGYTDKNGRAIILDTLTSLRMHLDEAENIWWRTDIADVEKAANNLGYYSLKSIKFGSRQDLNTNVNGTVALELRVHKSPFRIEAIREVTESAYNIPFGTKPHTAQKIIWSTPPRFLGFKTVGTANNVILTSNKPGHGKYLGFGGQGGQHLLKRPTLMNYFNFDNMTYSSVYGLGPKDEREPLYHSEPYWIELGGVPGYKSQVSTFIENHSQVMVDFLSTNSGQIRAATRFGEMQYCMFSGDDLPELIRSVTSVLGRSSLKPRYTLGHHQSCYGYDSRAKVLEIGREYVKRDIPLDAIHIDVDLQEEYRTFTIDVNGKFPNPKAMFAELRGLGIVCATNITPVINNHNGSNYQTLQDALEKDYFLPDIRYNEYGDGPVPAQEVKYIVYENGTKFLLDPSKEIGTFTGAKHNFLDNYDTGKPYAGGVGYGGSLGAPGHYLDLNRKDVREFWGQQYAYIFEQGIEFIWQDMTTPSIAKEYGDVKGLPFRLMVTDDSYEADGQSQKRRPAIEIWALYSYNLHKATFEGLNKLPSRYNKRNLIIGRGSFAGQHRYAGLWTGDNASSWDHFQISVSQVLGIGLIGNEISGADVGGFMPRWVDPKGFQPWAEPELLIRWYGAYTLLPWFRNHYHGKRGMKLFQEPWAFTDHYFSNPRAFTEGDRYIWLAVEPVCRYFIKLRYTLMQLLYDAMFEHQFDGLPIARALIITDSNDTTLLSENDWCLDNQYMVRNDLLVCPVMKPHSESGGGREIYLPQSSWWYPFNLGITPEGRLPGRKLAARIKGGDRFFVDAHISSDDGWLPHILPMYVREGGIIPQISVRQSTTGNKEPNPVVVHFYPGENVQNEYSMYLDDGVSRSSAHPHAHVDTTFGGLNPSAYLESGIDPLAAYEYCELRFSQICTDQTRTIGISCPHDGYGLEKVQEDIGDNITIIVWHEPGKLETRVLSAESGIELSDVVVEYLPDIAATKVVLPVGFPHKKDGAVEIVFDSNAPLAFNKQVVLN
ncbi:glycosyl hydrolases family 31-domain-containing protein [Peziza echinospora]|nr:glycosyl hydrolases family 31-domain-containing protein [Peziza echinospora]